MQITYWVKNPDVVAPNGCIYWVIGKKGMPMKQTTFFLSLYAATECNSILFFLFRIGVHLCVHIHTDVICRMMNSYTMATLHWIPKFFWLIQKIYLFTFLWITLLDRKENQRNFSSKKNIHISAIFFWCLRRWIFFTRRWGCTWSWSIICQEAISMKVYNKYWRHRHIIVCDFP